MSSLEKYFCILKIINQKKNYKLQMTRNTYNFYIIALYNQVYIIKI